MAKGKNIPVYTGLTLEELQALSECSGEAVRVYWALSMYCYGNKWSGYAGKETIIRNMGKECLLVCPKTGKKKNWKQPFNRILRQLEEAGLLDRGDKTRAWCSSNPWTLTLKRKIVRERLKQKGSTSGTNKVQEGEPKKFKARTNKVHHKNKKNNIINNKFNNTSYSIEHENCSITAGSSMIENKTGNQYQVSEILVKLEKEKNTAVLWNYHIEDLNEILKSQQNQFVNLREDHPIAISILKDWFSKENIIERFLAGEIN